MRPLPDLSPLSSSPSVYQAPQDSFLALFANDLNEQVSTSKSIAQGHDTLAANIDPLYTMLNEIVNALGTIISIFDQLSSALDAVNLVPDISAYQALDDSLVSNLDSWAPDIASLASGFLATLIGAVQGLMQSILQNFSQNFLALIESWTIAYVQGVIGGMNPGGGMSYP